MGMRLAQRPKYQPGFLLSMYEDITVMENMMIVGLISAFTASKIVNKGGEEVIVPSFTMHLSVDPLMVVRPRKTLLSQRHEYQ
jgi:hypothetical protein